MNERDDDEPEETRARFTRTHLLALCNYSTKSPALSTGLFANVIWKSAMASPST